MMRFSSFSPMIKLFYWLLQRASFPLALILFFNLFLKKYFFPDSSAGKESTCNAGDLGLIPGLGRSLGEGKGYPLQYFGLENSRDCIVHGVAKSRTWLRDFHFHFLGKISKVVLVNVLFISVRFNPLRKCLLGKSKDIIKSWQDMNRYYSMKIVIATLVKNLEAIEWHW